jgi:hypothetical protein
MFKYVLISLTCAASFIACQSPAVKMNPNSARRKFIRNETEMSHRKNWSAFELRGRIKSIVEFRYNGLAKDTLTPDYKSKDYLQFDNTGNLSDRFMYDRGVLSNSIHFEYNAAGLWLHSYYYGAEGDMIFRKYHIYDSLGNLLEEGQVNKDRNIVDEIKHTYDQYGGIVRQQAQNGTFEYMNTYDEDGVLVQQQGLFNKIPVGKITWKVDSIGLLIEEKRYDIHDKLVAWKKNSFNNMHLPTLRTIKEEGKPEKIQKMEYDSLGSVIRQASVNPLNGELSNITWTSYEYDATGNWVKATVRTAGDVITGTAIRKIIYY